MGEKTKLAFHKRFVMDKSFVDKEGVVHDTKRVSIPKGITVNGVYVGGASFLRSYCYPSPDNPDYLIFTFKEGERVKLKVPTSYDENGKPGQYVPIEVSPKDLFDALEAEREAWRARQYAKKMAGEQDAQAPERAQPKQPTPQDNLHETISSALAAYAAEQSFETANRLYDALRTAQKALEGQSIPSRTASSLQAPTTHNADDGEGFIPFNELTRIQAQSVTSSLLSIRLAAARKGYGLDVLVDDQDPLVRIAVAEKGFGLDKLLGEQEDYVSVADAAFSFLDEHNLTLEQWMAQNPEKCAVHRSGIRL